MADAVVSRRGDVTRGIGLVLRGAPVGYYGGEGVGRTDMPGGNLREHLPR